ncbi:MAG: T9SS type A sorting domain-containing protein, partial [Chitinophagales bacterium]
VNKNPNASISAGGPTTFCAGGSVNLTEVAVAGCTYQWYKGASPIAGATALTYTATTSGNYKCRVTKAATGCYKNSNVIAVSVPCKEGDELLTENNNFTIYPNPNNGTFAISDFDFVNQSCQIEIYNAIGQQIYILEIATTQNAIEVQLSNIASGIYIIKIRSGGNVTEQKLIIE